MADQREKVTETELAILEVLWDHSHCTVRQIVERLYGKHNPAMHATVKSLLERLAEKGYIARDTRSFAHAFSATVTREEFVALQLQKLADSHFNGALAPMLLTLVERVKLSRRDRLAIQKIIEKIQ